MSKIEPYPPEPVQYHSPAQYHSPGQASTAVVITQPGATVVPSFRETPVHMKCVYCHADVITRTYYETGTFSWVACFVIACAGCYLGCCLIPFFMDAFMDVIHRCPNCNQQLGRYSRM